MVPSSMPSLVVQKLLDVLHSTAILAFSLVVEAKVI